jgi:hypothetical protein
MQQKENDSSTLAEQSLKHGKKGLTFEDKYVILQVKNQRLKGQIRTLGRLSATGESWPFIIGLYAITTEPRPRREPGGKYDL